MWKCIFLCWMSAVALAAATTNRVYRVVEGDSAESLAERFLGDPGIKGELLQWNGIPADAELVPGILLVIPGAERKQAVDSLSQGVDAVRDAMTASAPRYAGDVFQEALQSVKVAEEALGGASYLRARLLADYGTRLALRSRETADREALEAVSATLYPVAGLVEQGVSRRWDPVSEAMALAAPRSIRTGRASRARLDIPFQYRVELLPESELELLRIERDERDGGTLIELRLLRGQADLSMPGNEAQPVQLRMGAGNTLVDTPDADFSVALDDDGVVRVMSFRGETGVQLDEQRIAVGPGQGAVASRNRLSEPLPLPPGAEPITPTRGVVTPGQLIDARWNPSGGKAQYKYELSKDPAFVDVLESGYTSKPTHRFGPLDEGLYFLRVAVRDQSGLIGLPGPAIDFTVKPELGLSIGTTSKHQLQGNTVVTGPEPIFEIRPRADRNSISAIQYRVDDGPWQFYGGALKLGKNGTYTMITRALGLGGVTGEEHAVQVVVDGEGPSLRVHASPVIDFPGVGRIRPLTVLGDDLSGVESVMYRSGWGRSWKPYSSFLKLEARGSHKLTFRAADSWGNTTERTVRVRGE